MTLANKVTQLNTNSDRLHQIVNGGVDTVVMTDGGPVKSIANVIAGAQAILDELEVLRPELAAPGGADLVRLANGQTVEEGVSAIRQDIADLTQHLTENMTTTDVTEGDNLYFTAARVLGVALADLSLVSGAAIANGDTVVAAFGKLQKQMNDKASKSGATLTKPTIVGYIEQFQALNPGAAVAINPDLGTLIEITTTANLTVNLPPPVAGMSYTLIVIYGGAHTVTFAPTGGTLGWFGKSTGTNTAPVATMLAGKKDCYAFLCGAGYTQGRDGGRNG